MIKKLFRVLAKMVVWFLVLSISWVLLYKYIAIPYTPLMAIRSLASEGDYDIRHQWVPISQISSSAQLAIICSEDQNFVHHNGFDYEAIKKAISENKKGKKLRGGSTISQQTAKNVFLWPERSWVRKGFEAYFTFLIELFWSKERILEVYLNSIEMGEGVFGIEAAAQYWFERSAQDLSLEQASTLAAILPNPRKYSANPPSSYIKNRSYWIQKQMKNYGTFTLEQKPDEPVSLH